ncbi:histidine phosphatase family protein [Thalassobacillus devorans]|uniref:histidine phosphatase family protein n=1 Tax=Thalassobacillus devorans TaxID=279813 RepID=UPI00048CCDA2|nr:alpha-ribazole phosphatase family protein [Thalassobacillus devorans]
MGACDHISIYFIRHGMTKWNKEKRYLGHSDEPLLPEHLPDLFSLKEKLSRLAFDQVFTSDLKRCRKTAEYLVQGKVACADPNLREMNFGDWEGYTHPELQNDHGYQHWISQWKTSSPPNGEDYHSFRRRVRSFLIELLKNNISRNVLVVTHGGVIREIMNGFIQGLSFTATNIPHGGGIRMVFNQEGGDWKCSSWSVVPIVEKENS